VLAKPTPKLTVELNPNHEEFSQLFTIITCLKKLFLREEITLLAIIENREMGTKHLAKTGSNSKGMGGNTIESINQLRNYFRRYVIDLGYEPTLINPCFENPDE